MLLNLHPHCPQSSCGKEQEKDSERGSKEVKCDNHHKTERIVHGWPLAAFPASGGLAVLTQDQPHVP